MKVRRTSPGKKSPYRGGSSKKTIGAYEGGKILKIQIIRRPCVKWRGVKKHLRGSFKRRPPSRRQREKGKKGRKVKHYKRVRISSVKTGNFGGA